MNAPDDIIKANLRKHLAFESYEPKTPAAAPEEIAPQWERVPDEAYLDEPAIMAAQEPEAAVQVRRAAKPTDPTKLTKPTAERLAKALAAYTDYEVAYDEFLGEIMRRRRGAELEWERWTDDNLAELLIELEQRGFATPGVDLLRRVVSLVASRHAFDSAIAWINSLPAHDGVARVETFLQRYYGVSDTPYARAVSRYIWSALAGRVLEPGCKADMAPVLIGRQGLGKTHSLAAMVPAREHYAEIDLSGKSADLSRLMRGKLIGELAELSGMRTREIEAVKAFMTRCVEEWVPKFFESTKRYSRRLIFIGTSNEPQFLVDATGNRRWLPVNVECIDVDAIARDRDQLWAEGRAMFLRAGIHWQDAERLAFDVHADHMVEDTWMTAISQWINTTAMPPITTRAVLTGALGFHDREMKKAEEMRVSDVLKKLGYERVQRRLNGARAWVWECRP